MVLNESLWLKKILLTIFVTSFPRIRGLFKRDQNVKWVTEITTWENQKSSFSGFLMQDTPYSSYVIPPFPISSISRSFHFPGPAFWPSGAAKSMIRAIAQSSIAGMSLVQGEEKRRKSSRNPASLQSITLVHGQRSSYRPKFYVRMWYVC